jgi:glyoxylase-like metal-dependent hydrolase (beta-lactamase superfamily II)
MHPNELPIATRDIAAMVAPAMPLDRWVVLPVDARGGRRRREAVFARSSQGEVARTFQPDAGVPGLPGWECIPTAGHTPGHVSYFRPRDRVLITGDALVTMKMNSLTGLFMPRPGLSGPPWYTNGNLRDARESAASLARLRPAVSAGGHGKPVTGTDAAAVRAPSPGSLPTDDTAAAQAPEAVMTWAPYRTRFTRRRSRGRSAT